MEPPAPTPFGLQDTQSAEAAAPLGTLLSVNGSKASVRLRTKPGDAARPGSARATVGKFINIRTEQSLLIGVVTHIAAQASGPAASETSYMVGDVDLLGEIRQDENGKAFFQRGVSEYPTIGDPVDLIDREALRLIYNVSGLRTINIGRLQQDMSIDALIDIDNMVTKHFALLGTTGVGKSSGTALLLQQVLAARDDLRIFMIDPHNEYGRCFGEQAHVLNPNNLKLPFWLFNFEEFVDVVFRGRPGVEDEVEILAELIPIARASYASGRPDRSSIRKNDAKGSTFTLDTPVPYRLPDLVALIDERMGKLENRSSWARYHRLIGRIEAVRSDPRYAFMFDNATVGGDTMVDVLGQLFRLPPNGRPMTVMQLAGFPAEVVDSVVSVVCRMAFDFGLWSDGALPLLVVCEEAHRYAPADRTIGFGPTRKAVSRIAKEGRKYGVFLGVITQRPAELDATILSQCSTLFAMRMANDRDQDIVRAAVSDAAASLLAFVPSLGTREVFAFGEGVALPTRLKFRELPAHLIPKSEALGRTRVDYQTGNARDFIAEVVERWRGATMGGKLRIEDDIPHLDIEGAGDFPPLQPSQTLDPERFDLLKRTAARDEPVEPRAQRPARSNLWVRQKPS